MTSVVERHQIPDRDVIAQDFARLDASIPDLLERLRSEEKPESPGGPTPLGRLWGTCVAAVEDLSLVDPTSRRIRELAAMARQSGVGLFWASEGPTSWPPVRVPIGPVDYQIPATGRSSETTPQVWETVMWQQEICRMGNAPKMLIADDEFTVDGTPDPYVFAWVEAMRAVWSRASHAISAVTTAIELSKPENAPNTDSQYLDRIVYPKMRTFYYAIQGLDDKFNESLRGALEQHRRYYEAPQRAGVRAGLISWPLLGIACMAMTFGNDVRVTSDYLPEQLLYPTDWADSLGW
ncbi:immunity 49 family protein [Gordonia sp. CPCC 206044]|uniref:immunity 49 family protein n=1 Tax=Gordonia sp. CPCC 206044 TaxID=3140793 RepID=UPI003AF3C967